MVVRTAIQNRLWLISLLALAPCHAQQSMGRNQGYTTGMEALDKASVIHIDNITKTEPYLRQEDSKRQRRCICS